MNGRVAVAFAGGGARGAYEAGAFSVIGRALAERGEWPEVFTGASVGAVNAASVAGLGAVDPDERFERALERWRDVVRPHVFRSVAAHAPRLVARYLVDLVAPGQGRVHAILDTTPLERHLARWIDWPAVAAAPVHALAVAATAAYTRRATIFWQGARSADPEDGTELRYVRTTLGDAHVRAAAAIPVLFPAVRVEAGPATGWYLDGSTRLRDPLQPARDLGGERMLVLASEPVDPSADGDDGPQPTLADAAATALQAALAALGAGVHRLRADGIPHAVIAPREHGAIPRLAAAILRERHRVLGLPRSDLGLLDRLVGADSPLHGELLSYVLFDREFIEELIAMGARDARAWLDGHPEVWTT